MTDRDVERTEDKRERRERDRRVDRSIQRDWAAAGHTARGHLTIVASEGDRDVLRHFIQLEGSGSFPQWLASMDMVETSNEARYAELRKARP